MKGRAAFGDFGFVDVGAAVFGVLAGEVIDGA